MKKIKETLDPIRDEMQKSNRWRKESFAAINNGGEANFDQFMDEDKYFERIQEMAKYFRYSFNDVTAQKWAKRLHYRKYTLKEVKDACVRAEESMRNAPSLSELIELIRNERRAKGIHETGMIKGCARCKDGVIFQEKKVEGYNHKLLFTFRCNCVAGDTNYSGLPELN